MLPIILGVVALIIVVPIIRKASARKKEQLRIQQAAEEERRKAEQKKKEEEERQKKRQAERDRKESEIQSAIARSPGSEKYRIDKFQSEVSYSLLNITEFTPISKDRFVAFDLETTGLSRGGDDIIEIGAVRVEKGQITAKFHKLVNPGCSIPAAASAVNHITDDMVADMPKIHQVLPAFLNFVGDDVLAAHNARFDAGFLNQACGVNRFMNPRRYFDTMELARYWPEASDRKLGTLIAAAGIENDAAHRALGDARAVAQLILVTNEKRKASRKKAQT